MEKLKLIDMILTVVSGVVVYIICQILVTIWLEPLQQYKKIKCKIAECLVEYAPYHYPTKFDKTTNEKVLANCEEASIETRKCAAMLSGYIETLSFIKVGIPSKNELVRASSELIGLSNSFFCSSEKDIETLVNQNNIRISNIKKILKITELK